jgi:hypothetical protein
VNMTKQYITTIFIFYFLWLANLLSAQPTGVPLNSETYHIVNRLEILNKSGSGIHTEIKDFSRDKVLGLALHYDTTISDMSRLDQSDLLYLFDDNNEWLPKVKVSTSESKKVYTDSSHQFYRTEIVQKNIKSRDLHYEKPLFKYFFKTPANFFEVNSPHFTIKINPTINFQLGRAQNETGYIFHNQRGIEIRGDIDNRVFFYTNIEEIQARFPQYATRKNFENFAVPGTGFYKPYISKFFKISDGVDYNNAQAYIGIKATKHIGLQLGHGQHFIGNGYRSLFLSNYAANQFFLKMSTQVWKFHYQSIFSELSPTTANIYQGSNLLPKKYTATHYLNFKARPNLSFGVFESVVFNRRNNFELQYLNPIIFYRTVEGIIGSPDNEILGLDAKWNLFHHFQLYGQFLMDEFNFKEIYKPLQKGWWANKYGVQVGLKYINFLGIDHLDVQLEYNKIRPYTYSHFDSLTSYTQYRQPLAHPMGSNFSEFIGLLRYKPFKKLLIQGRILHIASGENTNTLNWGSDPMLSYDSHVMEYQNTTGQGIKANINIFSLDASWQLYHNMFVDLKIFKRIKKSEVSIRDESTNLFSLGVRLNTWNVNRTDF